MQRMKIFAIALAGVVAATAPAMAGPEVNTSTGIVLVDGKPAPGLAVHGYDVVAYFKQGRPVKGSAKFAAVHGEGTYRFATAANRDAFKAAPAKYAPAYGGYCAYGVSVGAKFDGDPRQWKIVDGRLYLNLDAQIASLFAKDVPGAIAKAEVNWRKIASLRPGEIK